MTVNFRYFARLTAAASLGLMAGCASMGSRQGHSGRGFEGQTSLRIKNTTMENVEVYVFNEAGERWRLGFASPTGPTVFHLPAGMFTSGTSELFHIVCQRPGGQSPACDEKDLIRQGDTLDVQAIP